MPRSDRARRGAQWCRRCESRMGTRVPSLARGVSSASPFVLPECSSSELNVASCSVVKNVVKEEPTTSSRAILTTPSKARLQKSILPSRRRVTAPSCMDSTRIRCGWSDSLSTKTSSRIRPDTRIASGFPLRMARKGFPRRFWPGRSVFRHLPVYVRLRP